MTWKDGEDVLTGVNPQYSQFFNSWNWIRVKTLQITNSTTPILKKPKKAQILKSVRNQVLSVLFKTKVELKTALQIQPILWASQVFKWGAMSGRGNYCFTLQSSCWLSVASCFTPGVKFLPQVLPTVLLNGFCGSHFCRPAQAQARSRAWACTLHTGLREFVTFYLFQLYQAPWVSLLFHPPQFVSPLLSYDDWIRKNLQSFAFNHGQIMRLQELSLVQP